MRCVNLDVENYRKKTSFPLSLSEVQDKVLNLVNNVQPAMLIAIMQNTLVSYLPNTIVALWNAVYYLLNC